MGKFTECCDISSFRWVIFTGAAGATIASGAERSPFAASVAPLGSRAGVPDRVNPGRDPADRGNQGFGVAGGSLAPISQGDAAPGRLAGIRSVRAP